MTQRFAKPIESMTRHEISREEASLKDARDKTRKALLSHRRSATNMAALIRTYDWLLLDLNARSNPQTAKENQK